MSIAALCSRHSVDIRRQTSSIGAAGGAAYYYPLTHEAVRCWVQPVSARDQVTYMQAGYAITHNVYFSADPDVQSGDYLIFEGTRVLQAMGPPTSAAEMKRLWKVVCQELESSQDFSDRTEAPT